MNKSEKALNELQKGIQTYVDRMVELAPFDKTVVGIVKTAYDNNLYTVTVNQQDYNNVACLFKGLINVGDVVKVRIPQNNNNLMYIDGKLNAEVQSGGGGTTDYDDLSNKPQINGVSLSGNKTTSQLGINIPTKTSDLTNDSNFVSDSNYVHTDNNYTTTDKNIVSNVTSNLENKVDKVNGKSLSTNDFTTAYMNKLNGIASGAEVNVQSDWSQTITTKDDYIKNKPTKLSDFTNDQNFIDNTVNNLTNYYLKSNTYTKTEVNNLISSIVTLNIVVVQALPTTNISQTTIYLVPKSTTQTNNAYDEYINLDGTTSGWEKIGDTEIDLSNYYTISQVDNLLSNKVDKVSGKGLSTNDFTTDLKTKLNGIATGAEVNVQADWDETDTTKDSYIKNKPNIPSGVVVDTSLSTTSVNPVQNKVITTELNKKANASSVPTNSAIIDLIYPIGSIYTSTINANPSTYFGGTWDSIGESYLIINNETTNKTQYKWERTA